MRPAIVSRMICGMSGITCAQVVCAISEAISMNTSGDIARLRIASTRKSITVRSSTFSDDSSELPTAVGNSEESSENVELRTVMLLRVLAILNLAMSPLVFIEMASEMAQTTWAQVIPLIPQIMRETMAGRIWMWRLAAVVTLAIVVWLPLRPKIVAFAALVLSVMLLVLGSLASHAIDKGVLVVAIY